MLNIMKAARAIGVAFAVLAVLVLHPDQPNRSPRAAHASVAVAMSLQELVDLSQYAVVARGLERQSKWEKVGGNKRIVTYTKVQIEQTVVGKAPKTVWIRTLGGVVGKIGQHVSGEARIAVGSSSLLFLMPTTKGSLVVTARAQGHYPVVNRKSKRVLVASPDLGTVLPRRGPSVPAHQVLVGSELKKALKAVEVARKRRDERK